MVPICYFRSGILLFSSSVRTKNSLFHCFLPFSIRQEDLIFELRYVAPPIESGSKVKSNRLCKFCFHCRKQLLSNLHVFAVSFNETYMNNKLVWVRLWSVAELNHANIMGSNNAYITFTNLCNFLPGLV